MNYAFKKESCHRKKGAVPQWIGSKPPLTFTALLLNQVVYEWCYWGRCQVSIAGAAGPRPIRTRVRPLGVYVSLSSGLEASSHYSALGSFAALSCQTTAFTN